MSQEIPDVDVHLCPFCEHHFYVENGPDAPEPAFCPFCGDELGADDDFLDGMDDDEDDPYLDECPDHGDGRPWFTLPDDISFG